MTTSHKDALRSSLLNARRERSAEQHADDNAAWCAGVGELLTPAMRIAAYHPLGTEPGGPNFVETVATLCKEVYLHISGKNGAH